MTNLEHYTNDPNKPTSATTANLRSRPTFKESLMKYLQLRASCPPSGSQNEPNLTLILEPNINHPDFNTRILTIEEFEAIEEKHGPYRPLTRIIKVKDY